MSTRAGVGFSSYVEAAQAGIEACRKATKDISRPDILFVFSSSKYNSQTLLRGVRSIVGDVPLVGCTTAGEITGVDGSQSDGVAVMAIKSDTINFIQGYGGLVSKGARESGANFANDVIKRSSDQVQCFLLFSDVLSGNGAEIVRGILDVAGLMAIVVGGAAGDNFSLKQTSAFYNEHVLPSTVVGLGLSGRFRFGIGVNHGWMAVGLPQKVTKSNDTLIEEIDGKPAIQMYEDYFGRTADELRKGQFAAMAITYPLGMKIAHQEEFLVRNPLAVTEEGAIRFTADIPQGFEVRLMMGSREAAVKAAREAAEDAVSQLKGGKPKAALVFSCVARKKLLGLHANLEIEAIQSVIGADVPLVGFYTYGGQAPTKRERGLGQSAFHNEASIIMLIGD